MGAASTGSALAVPGAVVFRYGEEVGQMRLDGEPRLERGKGRIGGDLGRVEIQFLAPAQPGRQALLHDLLKEAPENVESIPLPDATETGVVGQRLGQVIAEIPAQAEPIGHHLHQLPLRAEALKEEDQLQFEEDDRVDAGAPTLGIGVTN